jgi:hypothetical protein
VTCDDYLSMLETLPVQELMYGEAHEHASYCHDCTRVTRVVAARERNMIMAYESAYPSASAITVAERAIAAARRQRIAFFSRAALSVAAVAVVALFVATRRIVPTEAAALTQRESFNLQCLSTDQAAALLRQQVPNSDLLNMRARPPLAVIEVEGPMAYIEAARSVIEQFDNSARTRCAAQVIVPKR